VGLSVDFEPGPDLPRWLAPELPFRRGVARLGGHRIHYVDEGEGPAVLLVHGNPSWSFLWRKVIRALRPDHRCVAPDLLGLGLSDKPRNPGAHQLDLHVALICKLVVALDLRDIVLVGQDWGGPIAMGVGLREPDRVQGIVAGNTAVIPPRRPVHAKAFHRFAHLPVVSDLVFRGLNFPIPVMRRTQGEVGGFRRRTLRAYWWPLRRLRDRAAPLGLARMVPDRDDHPSLPLIDAIGHWVQGWDGPAALVWGTQDPILGRGLRRHREALPQARVFETAAGHFSQEEIPAVWAEAIRGVAAD